MDYYFNFKEKAAKYSNAIGLLKQHNIPEAWPPKMEDSYSWEAVSYTHLTLPTT